MNGDHAEALLAYARVLATIRDAESATMTSVNRYGFDMTVKTSAGPRATRLAFPPRRNARRGTRRNGRDGGVGASRLGAPRRSGRALPRDLLRRDRHGCGKGLA